MTKLDFVFFSPGDYDEEDTLGRPERRSAIALGKDLGKKGANLYLVLTPGPWAYAQTSRIVVKTMGASLPVILYTNITKEAITDELKRGSKLSPGTTGTVLVCAPPNDLLHIVKNLVTPASLVCKFEPFKPLVLSATFEGGEITCHLE